METLKIAIGDGFLESFAQIPKAKQKKVMEFVAKFRHNPAASGINYEKLNDARDPNFRSVRIDQDYRGIVLKPEQGNVFVLLWVDHHDDAYDWARRHRCDIHPNTGVLQLLEIQQTAATEALPVAPQDPPPASPAKKLFDLGNDTLLNLGVPEASLDQVQGLESVEALEALEKALPIESFEALYLLAAGTPLEEIEQDYAARKSDPPVDTTDYAQALEHEASKRRFYVVDNEMELLEMLEAPLEKWRVFLHPSQRRLVERHWNGPVRVLGGAGTGKTVVAMHRARWLARQYQGTTDRVLFTTFTSNLATDIEENLRKICSAEELNRIKVHHIDGWVSEFLKRENYEFRIVYPGANGSEYESCWDLAEALIAPELGLPRSFYREEWERVVLPQSIRTREAYLKASRTGRGTPLSRKQRADIWPVFEEMRIQLIQRKLTTVEDAAYDIIAAMDGGTSPPTFRSIVVDEGQDFGPEMLKLIRRLVPEGQDDLFIVGDGHQRIYQRMASLGKCGINIRGRGKKLRINYRTTEEIRRFATAVLEGIEIDDMDEATDGSLDYRSLMHGAFPEVRAFKTISEEVAWLSERIEAFVMDGIQSQDICIVARTNHLLDQIEGLLNQSGVKTRKLSRHLPDKRNIEGIRLSTMHRIKGLEFKFVFMAGINKGTVPLQIKGQETQDPVEAHMREVNERALFHVAATRAILQLNVSCHGIRSEFLLSPA